MFKGLGISIAIIAAMLFVVPYALVQMI